MKEAHFQYINGAERVLEPKNIAYIKVGTPVTNGEETLENSKSDLSNINTGSVIIVKNGEFYVSVDPDVDAIKTDEEVENWLSKYIEM